MESSAPGENSEGASSCPAAASNPTALAFAGPAPHAEELPGVEGVLEARPPDGASLADRESGGCWLTPPGEEERWIEPAARAVGLPVLVATVLHR